ncbi:hypothetical protein PHYPSEUDO_010760 [Phytophthora pseudosyringae]|uniref:Uncharacterized protein n=1 Tax=Phytophthora pseudosyringae TaxID=221518 RepID=A0A8T1VA60_9STRA|nr:hypothetical protein PHYPSEUDO_010760 [Phytophthora pseudosyringae]
MWSGCTTRFAVLRFEIERKRLSIESENRPRAWKGKSSLRDRPRGELIQTSNRYADVCVSVGPRVSRPRKTKSESGGAAIGRQRSDAGSRPLRQTADAYAPGWCCRGSSASAVPLVN